MSFLGDVKTRVEREAVEHERLLTWLLVLVAAVLLVCAVFGKPHHKAMAMLYVVL